MLTSVTIAVTLSAWSDRAVDVVQRREKITRRKKKRKKYRTRVSVNDDRKVPTVVALWPVSWMNAGFGKMSGLVLECKLANALRNYTNS